MFQRLRPAIIDKHSLIIYRGHTSLGDILKACRARYNVEVLNVCNLGINLDDQIGLDWTLGRRPASKTGVGYIS